MPSGLDCGDRGVRKPHRSGLAPIGGDESRDISSEECSADRDAMTVCVCLLDSTDGESEAGKSLLRDPSTMLCHRNCNQWSQDRYAAEDGGLEHGPLSEAPEHPYAWFTRLET